MHSAESIFDTYLNDALRIHAVCADLGISVDNSKLYTYIHVKSLESGLGSAYFDEPRPLDVEAITALLGKFGVSGYAFEEGNYSPEEFLEAYKIYSSMALAQLEAKLRLDHGIERPFQTELKLRLRLYADENFRNKTISFYSEHILVRLDEYSFDKINGAFRAEQIRNKANEKELMDSIYS